MQYYPTHTSITFNVRGSYYEFDYPLVGKFNVENIMCAFGIGIQLGIGVSTIIDALREAPQIPVVSSACIRRMTAACRCSWTTRTPPMP